MVKFMEGEIKFDEIKLSKGFQFTLPADIRKKHKLRPGQSLEIIDIGDEIILRPKKDRSLSELSGKFTLGRKFNIAKELDRDLAEEIK